jgi:hypothetical protein
MPYHHDQGLNAASSAEKAAQPALPCSVPINQLAIEDSREFAQT